MIPALDRLFARFKAVFRKTELEDDLEAELDHHLDMLTAQHTAAGLSPAEARRRARIELGGVEQTRELHRETRGIPWLEQLGRDLRYTIRLLRRERGFATIAVLLVALGIGLNTTVFSLVNTVLLRPLPFAESERLIWITNGDPASSNRELSTISHRIDTWEGLLETNQSLDAIEAYEPFSLRRTYRLTSSEGEPQTIRGVMVSAGLFPLLGVKPLHGRTFQPEDAIAESSPVILLSYSFWHSHFGGDPQIVGETVRINDTSVQVIGVLPPADAFTGSFYPAVPVDMYSPLVNDWRRTWGNTVALVGRMKPGVTIDQAAADLSRSVEQLKQLYPDRGSFYFANVISLEEKVVGSLRQPLAFLWVAAGLVLAIASFNLGGLLLARSAARRNEIALRGALGAGRGRLMRQLLTETGALVVAGSLVGLLLAASAIRLLSQQASVAIPLLQSLRLDAAALGFTILVCILTAILCGVAPAWRLTGRIGLENSLSETSRGFTANRGVVRGRSVLVVLEIALACSLVISAGLMVRSFYNLINVDLGYDADNLIAVRIDPLVERDELPNYLHSILDRASAMPGVAAAGMTDCLPVERDRSWGLSAVDDPSTGESRDGIGAHIRVITPGLLEAMGTRLIEGREFDRLDSEPTIIINQSLAQRFWPGESAVNRYANTNGTNCRVIGVAEDVRHGGPDIPSGFEMYLPMRMIGGDSWDLMVRTDLPLKEFTAALRTSLREIDATLPLSQARHVETLVDRSVSSKRLMAALVAGFAAIALGLAALGLYGVVSYMVTQRSKEIGVRLALGASAAAVRRQIVGQTLGLALCGLVIGTIAALAGGRFLQAQLYGVNPFDPLTYAAMIVAALSFAIAAGYLPAHRASRLDPSLTLRGD